MATTFTRDQPVRNALLKRRFEDDDDATPAPVKTRRPRRVERAAPAAPPAAASKLTVSSLADALVKFIEEQQPHQDALVYGVTASGERVPLDSIYVDLEG